jgi:hypothetical protein
MNEWQIAVSIGQLIGTVGALVWFTRGLKSDIQGLQGNLQELQQNHNERLERMQEQHYQLREEIAYKFIRRDEWLAFNNKFEAEIKKHLERIEELLRSK